MELQEELEYILDSTHLSGLLEMLESVCYEKADYLATTWQNQPAASRWRRAARRISTCAGSKSVTVV